MFRLQYHWVYFRRIGQFLSFIAFSCFFRFCREIDAAYRNWAVISTYMYNYQLLYPLLPLLLVDRPQQLASCGRQITLQKLQRLQVRLTAQELWDSEKVERFETWVSLKLLKFGSTICKSDLYVVAFKWSPQAKKSASSGIKKIALFHLYFA